MCFWQFDTKDNLVQGEKTTQEMYIEHNTEVLFWQHLAAFVSKSVTNSYIISPVTLFTEITRNQTKSGQIFVKSAADFLQIWAEIWHSDIIEANILDHQYSSLRTCQFK